MLAANDQHYHVRRVEVWFLLGRSNNAPDGASPAAVLHVLPSDRAVGIVPKRALRVFRNEKRRPEPSGGVLSEARAIGSSIAADAGSHARYHRVQHAICRTVRRSTAGDSACGQHVATEPSGLVRSLGRDRARTLPSGLFHESTDAACSR